MAKRKIDGFSRGSVVHAFWDVSTDAKLKKAQKEYKLIYDKTRNKARRAEERYGITVDVRRLVRYQLESKQSREPLSAQTQLVLNVDRFGKELKQYKLPDGSPIARDLSAVLEWTERFKKKGKGNFRNIMKQRAFELIMENRKKNERMKQVILADKTLTKEEKKREIKKLKEISPKELYQRLQDFKRQKREESEDGKGDDEYVG